jgi:hypothetical protein
VTAVGRLLERRDRGTAAGPPALAVAGDRPRLDLDDQEATLGVGDDHVGLALALDAVVADDPGDVLEGRELGWERLTQPVVDVFSAASTPSLAASLEDRPDTMTSPRKPPARFASPTGIVAAPGTRKRGSYLEEPRLCQELAEASSGGSCRGGQAASG